MATVLLITNTDPAGAPDDQIETDLDVTGGHTVTVVTQGSVTLASLESGGNPIYDVYIVGADTSSGTIASADGGAVINFLDTTSAVVYVANKGSGVMPNMRMLLSNPTGTTISTVDVPDTDYDGASDANGVTYYSPGSGGGRINPTQLGLGAVSVAYETGDATRSIFFVYPLASVLADTTNTDQEGDAAPGERAYWNAENWGNRSTAARDLFLDALTQSIAASPGSAPVLTVQPIVYVVRGRTTEFGFSTDVAATIALTRDSGPSQTLAGDTTVDAEVTGLNVGTTEYSVTATAGGQTSAPQTVTVVVVDDVAAQDAVSYVGAGTPEAGFTAIEALNDGSWKTAFISIGTPGVDIVQLGTDRVDLVAIHVQGPDTSSATLDLFEGAEPPTSGGTPLETTGSITAPASDRGWYTMEPTASQGAGTKWLRVTRA